MGGARAAALVVGLALASAVGASRLLAHPGVDEVVAGAQAAAAAHPDDAAAQQELAAARRLAGDWDGALAALDAAAARGADADALAASRAAILLDAGRAAAALDALDPLLARRPDAAAARFDRGRACLALGRADEGVRELRRAIATLPAPRPEQVLLLRDALLDQRRIAEAIEALDAGSARLGPIAALQLPAVELEVWLGRTDAALTRLERLIAREGRNPAWLVRRAEILATAGRAAAARAAYEEAGALLAAHAGARRIHAFDEIADRIAAALAAMPPRESDICGLQSDAVFVP